MGAIGQSRFDAASTVYTHRQLRSVGLVAFSKMLPTHSHITNSTLPSKAMRLVVLGANGNSGRQFVNQALENGHRVIALVRSPEKMDVQHENLTVRFHISHSSSSHKIPFGPLAPKWICATSSLCVFCALGFPRPASTLAADTVLASRVHILR